MSALPQRKYFKIKDNAMDFYEDEKFNTVMESITDVMGYIILDIINMSLKKIKAEIVIYDDILESILEARIDTPRDF
jgi:hypothetical protein